MSKVLALKDGVCSVGVGRSIEERVADAASARRALVAVFAVAMLSRGIIAAAQTVPPALPDPVGPLASTVAHGLLREPQAIRRAINFGSRTLGTGDPLKSGFHPDFSNSVTGAGWIAAGPAYRWWSGGDRAFVDGSATVSWRLFKVARARAEFTRLARSRLALGVEFRWQDLTQLTYFGTGDDSSVTNRSEYRLTSANVVGYAVLRPTRQAAIVQSWGWLSRPSLREPTGPFRRTQVGTAAIVPDDPTFANAEQPTYLHGETSVTLDTRDALRHPTGGGVYRAAWMFYSDRATGVFTFSRYELEAAQLIKMTSPHWVMALHGFSAFSATAQDRTVPFYFLPALGGSTSLRGYADYRFHDRHLLLASVESRWMLFAHVDAAVFADAGRVAARVSDLGFSRTSYGAGLRMHSGRKTFARFDVARSREGWRFLFQVADPFHFSRLSRRTAALPFVF